MSETNPVNELIKIAKQNQEILAKIAVSQEELLEISRSKRNQDRWKIIFEVGKLVIWPIVILVGFFVMKEMIAGLIPTMPSFSGDSGASSSINLDGVGEILKLLGN